MAKASARADSGAKAVGPTVNVIAGGDGAESRGKTGDWLLLLLAVGLAALALSGGLEAIWATLLGWLRYGPAKSGGSQGTSGAPAPSPASSPPAQSPAPSSVGNKAPANLPSWLLPLAPFLGAAFLQKLLGGAAAAAAG